MTIANYSLNFADSVKAVTSPSVERFFNARYVFILVKCTSLKHNSQSVSLNPFV